MTHKTQITVFKSVKDTKGKLFEVDFKEFTTKLSPEERKQKDGRLYAFKKYNNDVRSGLPLYHSAIVIDFDNPQINGSCGTFTTYDDIKHELEDIQHLAHSTFSSTPEHPKWRLIIPTKHHISPEDYTQIYADTLNMLGNPAGVDNSAMTNQNLSFYFPSAPDTTTCWISYNNTGSIYTPTQQLPTPPHTQQPPTPPPTQPSATQARNNTQPTATQARNNTLKAQATKAFYKGKDCEQTTSELLAYDAKHHMPPLFTDRTEFTTDNALTNARKFTRSIYKSLQAGTPPQAPTATDTPSQDLPVEHTKYQIPQHPHPGLPPVGLVADIAQWIESTALVPQPAFALAGALSIVGILKAHTHTTAIGSCTNTYIACIGDTSAGKDWAMEALYHLTAHASCTHLLGGTPGSSQGLLDMLHRQDCKALCLWDELGDIFEQFGTGTQTWLSAVPGTMMRIWSRASSVYKGRELANVGGKKIPRPDLERPHLSVLGASTPGQLYTALSSKHIATGFLPRWIFFTAPRILPEKQWDVEITKPSALIMDEVRRLVTMQQLCEVDKSPNIIPIHPKAKELRKQLDKQVVAHMQESMCDITKAMLGKVIENTTRIALTICQDEILEQHMQWAYDLVMHSTTYMLKAIHEQVADSQYEVMVNKVLAVIREAAHWGITKRGVTLKTRAIPKFQRDQILDDLVESGVVESKQRHTTSVFKIVQI